MKYYTKRNKYGNKKVRFEGIVFDSKKEARRYADLKLLQQQGLISDLELQKKFDLIPTTRYEGGSLRKITYTCDFFYYDKQRKETIVEDVKGIETDIFKLKLRLFLQKYNYTFKVNSKYYKI